MIDFLEINKKQAIVSFEYLDSIVEKAAKVGAETAIEIYTKKQNEREILTTTDIAKELNVTRETVVRWIEIGRKKGRKKIYLKAYKLREGRTNNVRRVDLEKFLKLVFS